MAKIKISNKLRRLIAILGTSFFFSTSLVGCNTKDEEMTTKEKVQIRIHDDGKRFGICESDFTSDALYELPDTITHISLIEANFIDDLSMLPEVCPNLKELVIKNCPNITDLSFIYKLKNLNWVEFNDIYAVTPELVDYLNKNGITIYMDEIDLVANKKIDEIYNEIITPDMDDEQKLKAIVKYISHNFTFDEKLSDESNNNPLELTVLDNTGVCAGVAYTANILLRKAGIDSSVLTNIGHAWNLVKINDKYSYLDITNLSVIIGNDLASDLIDKYNITTTGYMVEPDVTFLSAMSDYDAKRVVIPNELVEDIANNMDKRTFLQKYGNSIPIRLLEVIVVGMGLLFAIGKIYVSAADFITYHKYNNKR